MDEKITLLQAVALEKEKATQTILSALNEYTNQTGIIVNSIDLYIIELGASCERSLEYSNCKLNSSI